MTDLEQARAAFWLKLYPSAVAFHPNEQANAALDALIAAAQEDAKAALESICRRYESGSSGTRGSDSSAMYEAARRALAVDGPWTPEGTAEMLRRRSAGDFSATEGTGRTESEGNGG